MTPHQAEAEFSMCASSVACSEIHEALQSARDELAEVKRTAWSKEVQAHYEKLEAEFGRVKYYLGVENDERTDLKAKELRDENERLKATDKREHPAEFFEDDRSLRCEFERLSKLIANGTHVELEQENERLRKENALLMDIARITALDENATYEDFQRALTAARAGGIVI